MIGLFRYFSTKQLSVIHADFYVLQKDLEHVQNEIVEFIGQ